ncbi:FG-GAP repeat protein [Actinomadura sp. DC4]|uniref:FG-GAP repeat protein n=1 Tax=Actinomadura sp. DC4 TaxID=3055069 RepID=UPI0025B1CEA1|nr:FG-GAP repeat protein [Actinomadura sp. DC4]MDN3354979.1 FG-GAP repeat protein [Actinomadura sp. DC4]
MKTTVRMGATATVILLTCGSAVGPAARSPHAAGHAVLGAAFVRAEPCHGHASADFDGDGRSDNAAGAPYATVSGRVRAGAVAVGYGGHVSRLAAPSPERDAGFGATLATGDFNGDHCDDLAVGVPDHGSARSGADGTGAVYLYYGSPAGLRPGRVLGTRDLGREPGSDRFGAALVAGDLDRDGRDDLVVGAPGLSGGGGVGVFTHGLRTRRLVTQRTSWVGQRTSQTDGFGSALAIGRFGGGRGRELAVGAPGDGDEASGAVTVLDPAAHRSRRVTQESGGVRGVSERYDKFGAAVAAVDVDHDGVDELAVGAPGEDQTKIPENFATGAVHVLYASGRDEVWTPRRAGHYDRFGTTLAAADLDGNGTADLVVSATGSGVVQVLNGHRGRGLTRGRVIASPAGRTAQFGWTLSIRGRDLFVGAPGAHGFGGAVYRVHGRTRTPLQNGVAGELLGYAVI